ncbi:MAG TPA: hypothetical protein VFS43_38090 [Polyangiaceae bacterium]|nr:hypothetical protein [Polyangiaceae bacterium]
MGILGSVFNFLGLGEYNAPLPVVSSGQRVPLQADARGRLRVAVETSVDAGGAAARTRHQSAPEGATAGLASSSPRSVVTALVQNRSASRRFFQLHDLAASPPSAGAVPVASYTVEGNATLPLDFRALPKAFATGVVWTVSQTDATYTVAVEKFFVEMVLQDLT